MDIKKTAYWIFKPLEPIGLIILGVLGLSILCGLYWLLLIIISGGVTLCTYFSCPVWIGYIWGIFVIWGILRIGYSIKNYCEKANTNGEII